jgi:hypothetical protein
MRDIETKDEFASLLMEHRDKILSSDFPLEMQFKGHRCVIASKDDFDKAIQRFRRPNCRRDAIMATKRKLKFQKRHVDI